MTPYGKALLAFESLFKTGEGAIPSGALFHYSHWWPNGVSVYMNQSTIVVMHPKGEQVFCVTETEAAVACVRLLVQ